MVLPIQKDDNQNFMIMQSKWSSQLNPVLSNPIANASILSNVSLVVGNNIINHLLDQMQRGWFLTDIQGLAVIYRNAPFNSQTLTLHSSATVTVSIGVF